MHTIDTTHMTKRDVADAVLELVPVRAAVAFSSRDCAERRALASRRLRGDPLIEPGLVANRTCTSGLLVGFALFGAFGGLLLCVSLFTQLGERFSPVHAGLTLMAMVIGMFAGMGAAFSLVRRLGRPRPRATPNRRVRFRHPPMWRG